MLKKVILITSVAIIMTACETSSYYKAVATEATKEAKDLEAEIVQDIDCLQGLGAWARTEDTRKRIGSFIKCVPDHRQFGIDFVWGGANVAP